MGAEETYWERDRVARVQARLLEAANLHREAIRLLGAPPTLPADADALEKLVGHEDTLVAEAALVRLAALRPSDLDRRLARLLDTLPDVAKAGADGPIHRQILWALDKLPSDVATDAIGRAIFFEGKSDAMPGAVSTWAAQMFWRRRGKAGRGVLLQAFDARRESVLEFLGHLEDASLVERLKGFDHPGAYASRCRLGDDSAFAPLIEKFANRYAGRRLLCELGPRAEKFLLPYLDHPKLAAPVAEVLVRVGGESSIAALEKRPQFAEALRKLRKRLGG